MIHFIRCAAALLAYMCGGEVVLIFLVGVCGGGSVREDDV